MTSDLTGARGSLETADGAVDIYRLDHLSDHGDIARLPKTVKILLENLLRRAGTRDVSDDDVRALGVLARTGAEHRVHARPRPDAGPDRRPRGGGPRRDALGDGAQRRRSVEGRPARPRRPDHRSLGAGGPVPVRGRVRRQHRVGVQAERRAIHAPALGAAGVRRPARGPAGRGDLPPGEPGASRPGGHGPRRGRVPRHARGDGLAHDHDQRPGRARAGAPAASRRRPRCSGSRCSCRSRS